MKIIDAYAFGRPARGAVQLPELMSGSTILPLAAGRGPRNMLEPLTHQVTADPMAWYLQSINPASLDEERS